MPAKNQLIWKTWQMGAAASERMERIGRTAHQSHVVDMTTATVLCRKVKLTSLHHDSSTQTNELPECPVCLARLQKANRAGHCYPALPNPIQSSLYTP